MHRLNLELKAKVDQLEGFQGLLRGLKAEYVGVFHQVDTYFTISKGRLKLREVVDSGEGELVYYERRDVKGPKLSVVYIAETHTPTVLKKILERVLGVSLVVDKVREVFRYYGVQVNLDMVKDLGTFLELEKQIGDSEVEVRKNRRFLMDLMKKMGVSRSDLQRGSYSDLILQREKTARKGRA